CLHVAVFPLASVAVQITSGLPIGKGVRALSVTDTPAQLPLATGVPKSTPVAVQPLLFVACAFARQSIVGEEVSVTVTVCAQVITLPPASVAVHVTVVVPSGKAAGASFVSEVTSQLSVATGWPTSTPVAAQPLLAAT